MANMNVQSLKSLSFQTRTNPYDSCCMRQILFSNHVPTSEKKSTKDPAKKKLSLVSQQISQNQGTINVVLKPKRKSMTSMEYSYPECKPKSQTSSKTYNQDRLRKSHFIQTQNLKPKPLVQIAHKAHITNNFYINLSKIPRQTNSKHNTQKQRISLNAIKASKIKINPLILPNRRLSMIQVSQEPFTQRQFRNSDYKSIESTNNFSQQPSIILKSISSPTNQAGFLIPSNLLDNQVKQSIKQISIDNYFGSSEVQLLHKSVTSHQQSPSSIQNNPEQIQLKICMENKNISLQLGGVNVNQQLVKKRKLIKNNYSGRTMTFAEQTKSQDCSDDERLSLILKSFKKLKHFQQYFNRGGFIGAGRISSVYRIEQSKTKIILASKEIFKKIGHQKDTMDCINKDVNLHYKLPYHQNILTLYGFFQDAGRYYFIEELCQTNLRNIMKQKLSQDVAFTYLKQILSGLTVLHSKKMIHRNLKPQNILMSLGVCKLSDFGWMDRLLSMSGHYPSYQYSSPEESLKKQIITPKSDCWSIGMIAFEMVTGHLPICCDKDILSRNKESLKELSYKYRDLLHGLLQDDAQDRFTSSKALQLIQSEYVAQRSHSKIQQLMS